VGTDVSAKYKGAFCEAKIRKISRHVKCKVRVVVHGTEYKCSITLHLFVKIMMR